MFSVSDRELGIEQHPRRARYGLLGGYKTAPAAEPRCLDVVGSAIRDMAEDRALVRPGGGSR